MELISQLDFGLINALQASRSEFLDGLMIILTFLGSFALPWVIVSLRLLIKPGQRKYGFVILLGMALAMLIGSATLKHIVMRDRPFNDPLGLLTVNDLIIPVPADRYSFPSGHALSSFAAATGIFMWDKVGGLMAYILAAGIALSRVYLYVHFPSDILAGALLGILCAAAAKWIVDKVEKMLIRHGLE